MKPEDTLRLANGLDLLGDYIAETGGCDHSVGVCYCSDRRVLENARAALATSAPRTAIQWPRAPEHGDTDPAAVFHFKLGANEMLDACRAAVAAAEGEK